MGDLRAVVTLGAALLVGCTSSGGNHDNSATVTGRLGVSGAAHGLRHISGSITLQRLDGRTVRTVTVDRDGRFTLHVHPGTYQLAGQSAKYQWRPGSCRAYSPTTVVASATSTVDVVCPGL